MSFIHHHGVFPSSLAVLHSCMVNIWYMSATSAAHEFQLLFEASIVPQSRRAKKNRSRLSVAIIRADRKLEKGRRGERRTIKLICELCAAGDETISKSMRCNSGGWRGFAKHRAQSRLIAELAVSMPPGTATLDRVSCRLDRYFLRVRSITIMVFQSRDFLKPLNARSRLCKTTFFVSRHSVLIFQRSFMFCKFISIRTF